MKNRPAIFLIMTSLLALTGCSTPASSNSNDEVYNPTALNNIQRGTNGTVAKNIPYGGNSEQIMDVYLPAASASLSPVILFLHGGGWHYGNKNDVSGYAEIFRTNGFTFISLSYRLGNPDAGQPYTLEEKLADMELALERIYSKQEQWNISDQLTLWGTSAGGHMALLYAYTIGQDSVDAVISHAGPTNLSSPEYRTNSLSYVISMLTPNRGSAFDQWLIQNSPVNRIPSDPPPILLVHGDADTDVIYQNSVDLHNLYLAGDHDSTLITLPGIDHMGLGGVSYNLNAPSYPLWGSWIEDHCR